MKVITIGDIHGRDHWKKINPYEWDLIIFIGDYVDSFNHSGQRCLENLREIIEFKEMYNDRVILLLGNHDIHYLYLDTQWRGAGFDAEMIPYYRHIFSNYYNFQIAYQKDNYLWTHAGVNKCWFDKHIPNTSNLEIANVINELQITQEGREALFNMGYARGGIGYGGPIWCGKKEMYRDPLTNFIQIVGHTPVKEIEQENSKEDNSTIYYIDCLRDRVDFLQLTI